MRMKGCSYDCNDGRVLSYVKSRWKLIKKNDCEGSRTGKLKGQILERLFMTNVGWCAKRQDNLSKNQGRKLLLKGRAWQMYKRISLKGKAGRTWQDFDGRATKPCTSKVILSDIWEGVTMMKDGPQWWYMKGRTIVGTEHCGGTLYEAGGGRLWDGKALTNVR